MTWYWDISNLGTTTQTLQVWDHTGTQVYTETRTSWIWDGDTPDVVYEQMSGALDSGLSMYNEQTTIDAATDNVVRGTPPA